MYCGGAQGYLYDFREVTEWLEKVSQLAGNLLYNGKEMKALHEIESYVKTWDSTQVRIKLIITEVRMKQIELRSTITLYSFRTDW